MKKLLVVLLSLGLVAVFSTSVLAVDSPVTLQFSGEFYAAGIYLDKTNLTKDVGASTAFYFQRLRIRTDFIVGPALLLITRFDAMERAWGASRSAPGTIQPIDSAGTMAENENIAFDWAYIEYKTPIGTFDVGYMNDGPIGTIFGDTSFPSGRIKYSANFGSFTFNAGYSKVTDRSYTANNASTFSDADNDKGFLEGVYHWTGSKAGFEAYYYHYDATRPAPTSFRRSYFLLTPYVIAKIGPVALQAEFNYLTGNDKGEDGVADVKLENYTGWIDAVLTLGPVYFGGTIAYVSGDDPNTADKREGGVINGGHDWSPTLIMWNYDRSTWFGPLESNATTGNGFGVAFANGILYQGRVGVKPVEKLDIMASLTYATADKKPFNYDSNQYGYEFDVTATYKITNNLTYMLGAGYLWTGDYFKGTSTANDVSNEYLVINKLSLIF
jgi:hypothetical protein